MTPLEQIILLSRLSQMSPPSGSPLFGVKLKNCASAGVVDFYTPLPRNCGYQESAHNCSQLATRSFFLSRSLGAFRHKFLWHSIRLRSALRSRPWHVTLCNTENAFFSKISSFVLSFVPESPRMFWFFNSPKLRWHIYKLKFEMFYTPASFNDY